MKDTTMFSFKLSVGENTRFQFKYFPIKFPALDRMINKNITNATASTKTKDSVDLNLYFKEKNIKTTIVKKETKEITLHQHINSIFQIQGGGLHREIQKTFFSDQLNGKMLDFSEYQNQDCSLIFVEPVSEETYVDQDEMRKLDYMVRLERI